MTSGPSFVTTTSSSIRAADQPSDEGQKVSRAKTIPLAEVAGSASGYEDLARPPLPKLLLDERP